MALFRTLMLSLLVLQASASSNKQHHSRVLDIAGDIRIGALFPIHKRGHTSHGPCEEIQKEDGIQPLEALLFTLDEINRDKKLLPNITLGVKAIDSCDNPYYAAEKSLSLLKGFITRATNMSCSRERRHDSSRQSFDSDWPCGDNIVGLIGPQTSPVSVQIASLGRLFHVPQVSYLATSVALCSRDKYPFFFRTVPSDEHQAKAIVELLNVFDWEYASIVHSDSDYGETGFSALKKHVSGLRNICLADPITIHNELFTPDDYLSVIDRLLRNTLSRVVIVFADRVPAGKLLEAAKQRRVKDKFVWVGSDAWASRESVVAKREEIVDGAIAVQPLRRELPGYDDYFTRLLETNNERNPWFDEYLQRYHNCSNNSTSNGHSCRKHLAAAAAGNGTTPDSLKYSQQLYIHFVRDAVYVFAHALHRLHRDVCLSKGHQSLCPQFKHSVFYDLKDYLQDVSFPDVAQKKFEFYGHDRHDGPPRYSIIYFQKNNVSGVYDWQNVGTFHHNKFSEWNLEFKERYLRDKSITRCQRRPCNLSEVIVQDTKDLCCWHCKPCSAFEYKDSDYECRQCPLGTRSIDENRTGCELIPETFLDYSNRWAIASMAFASLGIALTVVTAGVLWRYWNTPVVKACGRELSLLLLLGTFFSFTTTFAIVATPSETNCGIMRFCIGFCYTVCYAAVVTKTNRVARIFGSTNNPRFTSPLSSLVIAAILILVEVVINVVWMVLEPPTTTHIVSQLGKRILVCNGVDDSFMAGLVYPFFLILCATLYAFKTRKCPGGFNEARFIFFANSITCIHWVAYVPLYLVSTDPEIRAVILAFSLSLSGMLQLGCLLFPRVYTVLFKPEKNTRGDVMTNRGGGGGRQQRVRGKSFTEVPATPPNSYAFGVTASDILMTQMSTNSDVAATGGGGGGSVANIPMHVTGEGKLLQAPPSVGNNLTIRGRQMTWSNDVRNADLQRGRSSSVCRGTQTFRAKDHRKIKFSVNPETMALSGVNGLLDCEDGLACEDEKQINEETKRELLALPKVDYSLN